MAARPDLFRSQGSIVAGWRMSAGKRLGPYYSLRYREEGRQCSHYLGGSILLVDAVRRLLADQQRRRRQRLSLTKLRTAIKASLRRHKQSWRLQLERAGLTLKGFEIRNWRSLGTLALANPATTSRRE